MRMSPAELVAHHKPTITIAGLTVDVTFADQGVARAFFNGVVRVADGTVGTDTGRRETGNRPELRDMGATLLDKARARLLEAKADRLEKETAAEYAPPADPGPLAAHSVSIDSEQRRAGERVLRVGFSDGAGRDVVIALPFTLALKLNGAIGHAVAERLETAGGR